MIAAATGSPSHFGTTTIVFSFLHPAEGEVKGRKTSLPNELLLLIAIPYLGLVEES